MEQNQLAIWRARMGFSRSDACEALECSGAEWSRWESGEVKVPRYINLAMAALALGIGSD